MENKISERDEEQENKATSAERSQKDLIKWRKQYEYEAEENVKEKMQNLSLFTRNLDQWIKNPAQEARRYREEDMTVSTVLKFILPMNHLDQQDIFVSRIHLLGEDNSNLRKGRWVIRKPLLTISSDITLTNKTQGL